MALGSSVSIIPMSIPNPGQGQDRDRAREKGRPEGNPKGRQGRRGREGRKRPREEEGEETPPGQARRGTASRPQEGERREGAARDRGDNKLETARSPADTIITYHPSHASSFCK